MEPGVVGATWLDMPPGNENCVNSFFQSGFILGNIRINLAVGAFEIGIRDQCRAAVTGTGYVEHVEIVFLDDPVQVHVNEVLAWRRAPMSDHQGLHVSKR